ncbi:hypothetical protein AN216_00850 [Streptomyces oceani]|uniref:Lysoplasmalogenase n=1 Tax=Streptomyces oceani TaxID=1075402 RepID=A0A1E7KQ51_9ACTN|nr:hypothetical protein AN216_00850 [Streptomyces oceani]
MIRVFVLLAVVNLASVAAGWLPLEWATKPLLAPVLAARVWRSSGTRQPPVLLGFGFATGGDVALLVPGTPAFLTGMGFFLGAQLCWITAFVRAGALPLLRRRRALCGSYVVAWGVAVGALAPLLGPGLAVPIAGYGLALVVMALTAHAKGRVAAYGGAVFVLSDLLIGLGAAGLDFAGRPVLVMTTYVSALFLLARAFTDDRAPHGGESTGGVTTR